MHVRARCERFITIVPIVAARTNYTQLVTTSAPVMPLPVVVAMRTIYADACLAPSGDTVNLITSRLPPTGAIIPFPVAPAIRLCSNIGSPPVWYQLGDCCVLRVTVDARYLSALRDAIADGVCIVSTGTVVLEAFFADSHPTRAATCDGDWFVDWFGAYRAPATDVVARASRVLGPRKPIT